MSSSNSQETNEQSIAAIARLLRSTQRLTALTGAGVSAESGVPTFRGAGGVWRNHNAMDLATPQAFAKDPELVWEFYNYRRALLSSVSPNPAHMALVQLERLVPEFTLITQNVDGLHRRAGSKNIVEAHGNIWETRCLECHHVREDTTELSNTPTCRDCGGRLRPNVIWFGEPLDPKRWETIAMSSVTCEMLLVVGTSAVVQPVASLARAAKAAGRVVVEINLEETPNSQVMDFALHGKAGVLLPQILASM